MNNIASPFNSEKFLEDLANELAVPEAAYEKAKKRYENIGEFLLRDESTLKAFEPNIYSQGSIKLGTAIRPLNNEGEYDVDLVCEVKASKNDNTQKQLKEDVLFEVQEYANSNNIKKEVDDGRRCCTIEYSDNEQFHLDILPAFPENEAIEQKALNKGMAIDEAYKPFIKHAIAITDKESPSYEILDKNAWLISNPRGYYEWFKERKKIRSRHRSFDENSFLSLEHVEDIPEQDYDTPLQKVIMILKRHKDMMFSKEKDIKPISIIITTIAAHAYSGESTIEEALETLVANMKKYIIYNDTKGIFEVINPSNPLENFADKWEESPEKQHAFFKWLEQLEYDLLIIKSGNWSGIKTSLSNAFGSHPTNKIYTENKLHSYSISAIETGIIGLSHVEKPKWPWHDEYNPSESFKIVCTHKKDRIERLISSGLLLKKGIKLRFEASIPDRVKGYGLRYYWQIANSGLEATYAKQLRGYIEFADPSKNTDIQEGGKIWRKETTSYVGKHIVRCFLVSNSKLIAASETFVVDIA